MESWPHAAMQFLLNKRRRHCVRLSSGSFVVSSFVECFEGQSRRGVLRKPTLTKASKSQKPTTLAPQTSGSRKNAGAHHYVEHLEGNLFPSAGRVLSSHLSGFSLRGLLVATAKRSPEPEEAEAAGIAGGGRAGRDTTPSGITRGRGRGRFRFACDHLPSGLPH
ncbi:hypothetical protein ABZP36_024251 [Zizania latifolia]